MKRLKTGTYLAGDGRYVYRSSDAGERWIRVGQGRIAEFTDGYGIAFHIAYEHQYFSYYRTAGSDSLLNYSTDDGLTWRTWTFDGMVSSVVPVTPTLTYVLAGNKIYKRELPASVDAHSASTSPSRLATNPVSNTLRIHLSDASGAGEITIIDITGREVLRTMAEEQIDVSALPNGVYQLLVKVDGLTEIGRFVIER